MEPKDYIEAVSRHFYDAPVHIDRTGIKRELRRLVREAVRAEFSALTSAKNLSPEFAVRWAKEEADRIVKELVP